MFAPSQGTAWSFRVSPVRSFDIAPPHVVIIELNIMIWRREDGRSRYEVFWRGIREILCVGCMLSYGDIPRHLHELSKLFVRYGCDIHPKTIHRDLMHWQRIRHPTIC